MKKTILMIQTQNSTFVKRDQEILKKKFNILSYTFKPNKNPFLLLLELFKEKLFILGNIGKIDIFFIWFADYHSLIPVILSKIFKKKSIIIVGGYDAVAIPEINFGVFIKTLRGNFAKLSFKLAEHICPVDESLLDSVNNYISKEGLQIGVKHFVPTLKTNTTTIPTGYDHEFWKHDPEIEKEKFVLSIGIAPNWDIYRRKGFDLLTKIAKLLPKVKFVIIGIPNEMFNLVKNNIPENVQIIHYVPNIELPKWFSKAKVFCQLSLSEGLPNTLCEAMLCECIPVGSSANGIPKAIGNYGFILENRDAEKGAELIGKALETDLELGKKGRNRIIEMFSESARANELFELINSL